MKSTTPLKFVIVLLLFTACAPTPKIVQAPTATAVVEPAVTVTSSPIPVNRSMDDLRTILYASNPESPQYDPESKVYAEFPDAVQQLSGMGSDALEAAGDLAGAITYPRPDAYLAAQALLMLGPEITSTAIVTLYGTLDASTAQNWSPEALIDTMIVLSSTGDHASCAVGNIGPLLWDADARVRSAAAIALEKITQEGLVASPYEMDITPSFLAESIPEDVPEGSVVETSRQWWTKQGSKINWHAEYGLCDA
jgi:hypothetical protein